MSRRDIQIRVSHAVVVGSVVHSVCAYSVVRQPVDSALIAKTDVMPVLAAQLISQHCRRTQTPVVAFICQSVGSYFQIVILHLTFALYESLPVAPEYDANIAGSWSVTL